MSNQHDSDATYRPSGDEEHGEQPPQPTTTIQPNTTMPTEATNSEQQSSLHGSAERLPNVDGAGVRDGIRFRHVSEVLKVFNSKFNGSDRKNIDEWMSEFEILIKSYKLTEEEKAHALINSLQGSAFSVLADCEGTSFDDIRKKLLSEFRAPGAYWKAIQAFGVAQQGKNQKVSGFYHYVRTKFERINKMYKERNPEQDVLMKEDVAIAIFLKGLSNSKVREHLTSTEPTSLKSIYEQASKLEDTFKFSGDKRSADDGRMDKPKKQFKGKRFNQKKPQYETENRLLDTGEVQKRDLSKVKCYKCQRMGHYAKECPNQRVGAVTVLEEEVSFLKTDKSSEVFAKMGPEKKTVAVTIDSGADTNCISVACLESLGVTEINSVKAPEVRFAGNSQGKPLGMVTIHMIFHKDMEVARVKFLVFDELVPSCLLGIDGQDQLKVKLDREQDMVWIDGMPITLHQSEQEAKYRLGAVSLDDAFGEKIKHTSDSKRLRDYYKSDSIDDPMIAHSSMSFELPMGTSKEVEVEQSLSSEEQQPIREFLVKYEHMFGYFENKAKKPKATVTTEVSHQLITDGSIVSAKPYRLSPAQKAIVKDEIDKMLKLGIIRKSSSEYASPVVLVPKPDGSWRFCVDYRKLNNHTKGDKYPLPNISECLSRMKGAKYFAKLDLSSGYWQIPMHPNDIDKTAFVTHYGLYEFTVMPFGLKTAPATFQRMMDRLLGDMMDVMIYLDDVLIMGTSIDDLLVKTKEVFQRLDGGNLKLKAKKCHIGMREIDYLGHIVSHKGIFTDKAKTEAIKKMHPPSNVREVRRFLGMTSYYRNYIYGFAKIADPLTNLIGKGARFHWNDSCQKAFDKLKQMLCDSPVLTHPDYTKPFSIFTDASDVGVGAVLTQEGRPVWFASRVLKPAERKYDTREKECIAVMFGLEKFKPYYFGRSVVVFTDHGNLRWLMDHEQKGRLARWQLYLQQFDFSISYVKGKHNPVADCLSRDKTVVNVGAVKTLEVLVPRKIKLPIKDWKKQQGKDLHIQELINNPKAPYMVSNGVLYRLKDDDNKKRIVLPEHLTERFIQEAHSSTEAAHGGVRKTCYHLRGFWFSGLRTRVEHYVKRCRTCVQAKGFSNRHNELSTREPLDILERVYVDVVGPLPNDDRTYTSDARYILTMMDDGSRFLRAAPMRTCKRWEIKEAFEHHWISVFGNPRVIVSDNNEQFKGEFLDMCQEREIIKEWTAPYSPEMNAVERVHKTMMNKVRALKFSMNKPWKDCLPLACVSYNITVQDSLEYAPYALMFAKNKDIIKKMSYDISDIGAHRKHARTHAFQKRKGRIDTINNGRKDKDIKVGDKVLVRNIQANKLDDRTMGQEYTVNTLEAKNIVILEATNGFLFRRSRKDISKVE